MPSGLSLTNSGDEMKIGIVGLGKMGGAIAERLRRGAHEVVGYDRDPTNSSVSSLKELVDALPAPRVIWVMVPAGAPTAVTIEGLSDLLEAGDVIIDGGNSNFEESIARGVALKERGIHLVDAGTSGGIWGLEEGFCLMVGGDSEAVAMITPVLSTLAPSGGYAHVGPSGAGHFVKMIHNGIEYGMLQAYAEGFEMLSGTSAFPDLDMRQIASLWQNGSVVRSWLLDLTVRALEADPNLDDVQGYVQDSGEGRWMLNHAIEQGIPVPVAATALFARFASRQDDSYAMKMIAALRQQFGGHSVKEP